MLVPDVNRSAGEFTPLVGEDGAHRIVFGLAAVRNVGESLVDRIVTVSEESLSVDAAVVGGLARPLGRFAGALRRRLAVEVVLGKFQ